MWGTLWLSGLVAGAVITVAPGDDVGLALQGRAPGDEVLFAPGVHQLRVGSPRP